MNDADFSALEQRLAPVLAAGSSREYRREVEALLAECRRLREPPDASGLMTAAGLAAVKGSFARHVYPRPDEVAALLAHIDALGSLIRELYGVVADLHADDPGRQALLERGRAEGREQAARAVEADPVLQAHASASLAAGKVIRDLGPCRPPLLPSEAERQAGRLREALRQCLERLEWASDGHGLSPAHFAHAVGAARKALAEGGTP